jgi:hypothetical protein
MVDLEKQAIKPTSSDSHYDDVVAVAQPASASCGEELPAFKKGSNDIAVVDKRASSSSSSSSSSNSNEAHGEPSSSKKSGDDHVLPVPEVPQEDPPAFAPYEAESWEDDDGNTISHDKHLNEDGGC